MTIAIEQAIGDKSAKVGVIGLGYVGLPLIRAFAAAGNCTAYCSDVNWLVFDDGVFVPPI